LFAVVISFTKKIAIIELRKRDRASRSWYNIIIIILFYSAKLRYLIYLSFRFKIAMNQVAETDEYFCFAIPKYNLKWSD